MACDGFRCDGIFSVCQRLVFSRAWSHTPKRISATLFVKCVCVFVEELLHSTDRRYSLYKPYGFINEVWCEFVFVRVSSEKHFNRNNLHKSLQIGQSHVRIYTLMECTHGSFVNVGKLRISICWGFYLRLLSWDTQQYLLSTGCFANVYLLVLYCCVTDKSTSCIYVARSRTNACQPHNIYKCRYDDDVCLCACVCYDMYTY